MKLLIALSVLIMSFNLYGMKITDVCKMSQEKRVQRELSVQKRKEELKKLTQLTRSVKKAVHMNNAFQKRRAPILRKEITDDLTPIMNKIDGLEEIEKVVINKTKKEQVDQEKKTCGVKVPSIGHS